MNKQIIGKNELEKLGYSNYQSQILIRQAKNYMVKQGYDIYTNRKISQVPVNALKILLGFEPKIPEEMNNGK